MTSESDEKRQRSRFSNSLLSSRHQVFLNRSYARSGGLLSYSYDRSEHVRQAAGYVHKILSGVKPSDLPVQAPTKYELVVNLKTAKALGITVPPMLLARADEVIE